MPISWVLVFALELLNDVACYPEIGAYMPVSNVHEHTQISQEVKAFSDALTGDPPNYAQAKRIYQNGAGHSCKSATSPRTLQGFARADLTGETFHDAFRMGNYMPANFWDTWILEALDGTGRFAGLSRVKRVTSLKKGIIGLVSYYASHELESAITKAASTTSRSDSNSGHAWDEGWAFYYGADPDGVNSPWEAAKKRDGDFPRGTQVHFEIAKHFNKGLIAVRDNTYSATSATEARDTIYKMWAVTYLRAALKYLKLAESHYDEKAHAEGYAYYMAIDGWIHSKNSAAATKLANKLRIAQTAIPAGSYCDAKATLEAAYSAIGISCDIMSEFTSAGNITCSTACTSPSVTFPSGSIAVASVPGAATDVTCVLTTTTTTTTKIVKTSLGAHCTLHVLSLWLLVALAWTA